ncbi:MAG: aspartyl protease family protein [Blastocatellia bacterium]
MSHQLSFSQMASYDPGLPGITIETNLSLSRDTISCEAKIDTGATFCIFSRKIGEDLGLDVESGLRRKVGTVTGSFVVYLHEVNLSVMSLEFDALVGFAEDDAFQPNVLGRRGFLDQSILGLVDYEGKLFLSSYQG